MSEWRDISTAPRDGVFVLLHNDRCQSALDWAPLIGIQKGL
jgi:hypothetical protein